MNSNTSLRFLLSLFIICISLNASANNKAIDLNVTDLNKNAVQKWEHKVFSGESTYSILYHKGKRALKAHSDSTASGLLLKKKMICRKHPF